MAKKEKLVIFDGHALLHRGFHALPYLTAKDGTPTNGVYGFTMIMLKALSDLKPDYVAVGWDMPGKTFRHNIYPEYKATRVKAPQELYDQIPVTRELIKAFNIPLVELKGYEADDVIGAIAKKYAKDLEVIIVTGDMDELQLVDNKTKVYTMRRGFSDTVLYDEQGVKDKYGVTPQEFVVFKALKGDASDNIPGVTGIGDKTATDLVARFKTLDNIYKNLNILPPRVAKLLEEQKDKAYLSLELSKIKTDLKLNFKIENARLHDYDRDEVYAMFQKLDFKSLLNKLPQTAKQKSLFGNETESYSERRHLKTAKYTMINEKKSFDELVKKLTNQKAFAFDTETDSLDVINANLVGMSFCFKEGEAYYIPVGHTLSDEGQTLKSPRPGLDSNQLPKDLVLAQLKPILQNPKIGKIGHNLKFDYQVLKKYQINLSPIVFDSMVAAFLINPLVRAQTLSDLAFSELGISMIGIEELIGPKGKDQKTFAETDIHEATKYAAEDADIAWRLYQKLNPELEFIGKLAKLARDMEWPLIPVLGDVELTGVKLDVGFLTKFAKEINAKLKNHEEKIWKLSDKRFNISSTIQLKEVLFDKLKIQSQGLKKIKTGISIAAKELEKLKGAHPIIDLILEYREVVKLKTTYVDALPLLVNKTTGRIHTSYNQTIAQTGRLSSTNPNLQNIPIRTSLGKEVRKAFVAEHGNIFVSADYSQIELRLAAALASDKPMIAAFKKGEDIHTLTASELYDITPSEVTDQQRYSAKAINFGILYGMNPHGLSTATGMEHDQAKKFIEKYFFWRADLASYIEKVKNEGRKKGYTETIFGRRRPCPDINSSNFIVRSAAERAAVNMPLQGTAADMMKLAMIEVDKKLPQKAKMILQIHDELIVECPENLSDKVAPILKDVMENIHKFSVPTEVNISKGYSWGTLE
ncbi:MAG: DNA polymerase I [bacterium]|nr:DNA polymerase I [bacterium]